jgi:hypothetical protein
MPGAATSSGTFTSFSIAHLAARKDGARRCVFGQVWIRREMDGRGIVEVPVLLRRHERQVRRDERHREEEGHPLAGDAGDAGALDGSVALAAESGAQIIHDDEEHVGPECGRGYAARRRRLTGGRRRGPYGQSR